ncbi:MAG: AsmA-like C-terminal domain-containing protein [Proteobacteria bacterium]|nr:AsmA-like C-terminal domain-containing protein [Pseudomonadota bacterium]
MEKNNYQKRQRPVPTATRVRIWVYGSIAAILLLLATAILVVPRFIDFTSIKQKLQAVVTEKTGGRLLYQEIGLTYIPRLAIELRQVTMVIPDLAEGRVAALRISPQFLPLMSGNIRLARLELDTPQLRLDLLDQKPQEPPAQPLEFEGPGKSLALAVAPLGQVITGLEIQVNNGKLAIAQGKHSLVDIEGLNLSGRVQMAGDKMTAKIDRLTLEEPALTLAGELTLAPTTPAITVNMTGTNIDVDATRKTALSLAGDSTPIKQIFDYLRGGKVPLINFTSHGENFSQLGDLNNILIKGHLQDGKVSVPAIDINLTEVAGDVVITNGVLQGSGLSAHLDSSTGRDGTLAIGLTREHNLFKLGLNLSADLSETQALLKRVIRIPTFTAELEKITNLQGTAHGKLTLGDSLSSINSTVEIDELSLTADYQSLPLPITITEGQVAFSKNRLNLGKLGGSIGRSQLADLSCQLLFDEDLSLDISSGQFELDMAELYPWLASREGLREKLRTARQVTGRVALSTLNLKGKVGRPSEWKFNSTGTVQDLAVESESLPDIIHIASGGFKIDTQQLTFEKLQATNQDAALVLSGRLRGFPQKLERIELGLDGSMGPQSVEWLSAKLKVPTPYTIHAPLTISNAQVSWQPDATTSFKGLVQIEKGPGITADVDSRPDKLQVKRLHIKDQYSDATMVFDLNMDQRDLSFTGTLQHETLQALFVDDQFASGRVAGDFTVTIPQTEPAEVTTTGQLTGENLHFVLSPTDSVNIAQINLQADGAKVTIDINKLQSKNLTLDPVEGTVSFARDGAAVKFESAKVCDINTQGMFSFAGDEFSLDMTLKGKDLDVATSYTCLTEGRVKATGSLDFSSKITTKGKMNELVKGLTGPLQITLSNGVIEQDKFFSRILEVLNFTEIVKGRLPDLGANGLAYTTITLTGRFQNGKLLIDKFFMDGETLGLVGTGQIRLEDETLDIQLLAAPFKTVDTLVKYIPGVNYLLGDSLIAIPVSITGTLDDPNVTVLSPSAIGSSLYNLAERTITSPLKLIEKINLWGKGDQE